MIKTFNKLNDVIKMSFGKQMTKETQLMLYNITPKAAPNYGSDNWIVKQEVHRDWRQHKRNF